MSSIISLQEHIVVASNPVQEGPSFRPFPEGPVSSDDISKGDERTIVSDRPEIFDSNSVSDNHNYIALTF